MTGSNRKPQVCILGSAEPGSTAYELAGEAGALLAKLGITVVSGCGSPATRVAAERAMGEGGLVVSIIPPGEMPARPRQRLLEHGDSLLERVRGLPLAAERHSPLRVSS